MLPLSQSAPDGAGGYYVLRAGRLSAVDIRYQELGVSAGHGQATRLVRRNNNLFLFTQPVASGGVPAVEKVAASTLVPTPLAAALDAAAGHFESSQWLIDEQGVVYIYSKLDRNIYRWSAATKGFLPSIPLANTPNFLAYSSDYRALYFEENGYQVRRVLLDSGLRAFLR